MTARLGTNSYGKSRVRVSKVERGSDSHDFADLCVDIACEGEFTAAHVEGDNADVLPTDTMKNTVYGLAATHPLQPVEDFAERLADHLLQGNPQMSAVTVQIVQQGWERVTFDGAPDPHSFRGGGPQRTAWVRVARDSFERRSGVRELVLLKTTGSAFSGFRRDEWTTLPDTRDRILASAIEASWTTSDRPRDRATLDARWKLVVDEVIRTFATQMSESVQHTLHACARAVFQAVTEVDSIRFTMPNRHHLPFDVSRLGIEGVAPVFQPVDEPHGLIEAEILRR